MQQVLVVLATSIAIIIIIYVFIMPEGSIYLAALIHLLWCCYVAPAV